MGQTSTWRMQAQGILGMWQVVISSLGKHTYLAGWRMCELLMRQTGQWLSQLASTLADSLRTCIEPKGSPKLHFLNAVLFSFKGASWWTPPFRTRPELSP